VHEHTTKAMPLLQKTYNVKKLIYSEATQGIGDVIAKEKDFTGYPQWKDLSYAF
jgi:predicted GIY-YIG superfamily endonuclease